MKHLLTEWEVNGYDDSDFYASVYDDQTRTIEGICTGSTRYAGARSADQSVYPPISDPVVLQGAIHALTVVIFDTIRAAEYRDVMEPNDAPKGAILRTIRNCKHRGSVIPAGTVGEVFWCDAFGTFYRNGYNKPCRENRRVGMRLADGSSVYVALSACRLDREPMSDQELFERANVLADDCQFSKGTGLRHAGDSENYAAALYHRTLGKRDLVAA